MAPRQGIISVFNNTGSTINLDADVTSGSFSPALPTGTVVISSDCTAANAIAPGGFCTFSVKSSTTVSSNCTTGFASAPSVATITANSGSFITTANIVVLGYGYRYQGGYVYAMDDATATSGSIEGKFVAVVDQAGQSSTPWVPTGRQDYIWGIDETSTTTVPSPAVSLQLGQLDCNGAVDGTCNSNNMRLFPGYGSTPNYSAGFCAQPLTGSASASCTGGPTC